MTKSAKLIILGAGAPHRGDIPAALREPRSGTSMLQWLLDASGCTVEDATFVAGYQAEAIRARYPELPVVENPDWEYTGSGASLLAADFPAERPLLVCYSDILFRESVPVALAAVDADIAVAWDSAWEHRYAGRAAEDLVRDAIYDGKDYDNMHMTSFIQHLIDSGWEARAAFIDNGWAEVDCEADLDMATEFWNP